MNNLPVCLPCDGIKAVTPLPIFNRPGLSALKYRIGSHSTFFESLLARISTLTAEELGDLSRTVNEQSHRRLTGQTELVSQVKHPLRDLLTTREKTDPSIALLDAWSTLADVLTFYQERIANEGFLRTAQERRSIEKLAHLTGYRLRPGVSSTVYLAFEVEDTTTQSTFGNSAPTSPPTAPVLIPKGTAAKSTPTPGSKEEPQTFETSKRLLARQEWNAIPPRQTKRPRLGFEDLLDLDHLYFDGLGLRIDRNDWLVIDTGRQHPLEIRQVLTVDPDNAQQRTRIGFRRDSLSTQQLIEDIEVRLNGFVTTLRESRVKITSAFVAIVESRFRERVDEAYRTLSSRRLEGTDKDFHDFVCEQLLKEESPAALEKSILTGIRAILVWAQKAASLMAASSTAILGTTGIASGNYRAFYQALQEEQTKRVDIAKGLVADLKKPVSGTDDAVAVANSFVKEAIWAGAFGTQIGKPALRISPQGRFVTSGSIGDKLLVNSDVGLPGSVVVHLDVLGAPPGASDSFTANDIVVNTATESLRDRIRSVGITFDNGISGSRWVRITVSDTAVGTPLVALALQEVGNTSLSTDFPQLMNEKVVIFRRNGPAAQLLDLDFSLINDAAPESQADFSAVLTLHPANSGVFASTDPTYAIDGSGKVTLNNGALLTHRHLTKALRSISFNPANQITFDHAWASIVIKQRMQNGSIAPIAAALREIVVQDITASLPPPRAKQSLVAVRQQIGELLGKLQSPGANVTSLINDFETNETLLRDGVKSLKEMTSGMTSGMTLSEAMKGGQSKRVEWNAQLDSFTSTELRAESIAVLRLADDDAKVKAKTLVDNAKTNYDTEIKASEQSAAEPFSQLPGEFPILFERELANVANGWDSLSAIDAATKADESRARMETRATQNKNDVLALDNSLARLAQGVADELGKRQVGFSRRLDLIRQTFDLPFRIPNPQPEKDIKSRLDTIQSTLESYRSSPQCGDEKRTLGYQLATIMSECGTPSQTPPAGYTPIPGLSLKTLAGASGIAPSAQQGIDAINKGWKSLIAQLVIGSAPLQTSINGSSDLTQLGSVIGALERLVEGNVPSQVELHQILDGLGEGSDFVSQLASQLDDRQRDALFQFVRTFRVGRQNQVPKVFALRSSARLFGWNALEELDDTLKKPDAVGRLATGVPCLISIPEPSSSTETNPIRILFANNIDAMVGNRDLKIFGRPRFGSITSKPDLEAKDKLFLDGTFSHTGSDSVIAIQKAAGPDITPIVFRILESVSRPRSAYGLHGETTHLVIDRDWWNPSDDPPQPGLDDFSVVRTTRILCDADELNVVEEPIVDFLPARNELQETPDEIYLDNPLFGLSVGQPLIVEGPRQVGAGGAFVNASEIVEIAGVHHKVPYPSVFGERYVTQISLRSGLRFTYRRSDTRIHANVVEATHGETQRETVGSGNAAAEFQKFLLKRADVSQVMAPTVTGVKSALAVRVNDVEWEEKPDLKEAGRLAEQFVTRTDDAQQTVVVFGDGVNGARVPTGVENIRVEYRTGLGRKGNVGPGQISQLLGAPLGVKKVNNPLVARGGADPESRDDARSHVPLTVTAMDRLVSVQDFADFAMTYAGIGKASASLLQGTVHVTIAGLDPESLGNDSPLYRNLQQAMVLFGDPSQQFELHDREASLLILIAKVKIDPKRQWEIVQPEIRKALLRRFRYEQNDLGQDVLLSDAIAVIQKVDGVLYVDVDKFDAVKQDEVSNLATRLKVLSLARRPRVRVDLARITSDVDELAYLPEETREAIFTQRKEAAIPKDSYDRNAARLRPAQICYLTPDIPDTLILEAVR